MNSFIVIVFFVTIVAIVGYLSSRFLGNDNPIEEECEKIIKFETGKTVDLSPEENNKPKVDE